MSKKIQKIIYILNTIYILIFISGILFVIDDGYFNLLITKWNYFAKTSLVLIFYGLIQLTVLELLQNKTNNQNSNTKETKLFFKKYLWYIMFVISLVMGFMLSSYKKEILFGTKNWRMGIIFYIYIFTVIYMISEIEFNLNIVCVGWIISISAVCGLAIANVLGFDPLGEIVRLSRNDLGSYLSTIGNINWLGALTSLAFPFIAGIILQTDSKIELWIYIIAYSLVFLTTIWCNSDCALIGVIGTFVMIMLIDINGNHYRKTIVYSLSIVLLMICRYVIQEKFLKYKIGAMQRFTCSYVVIFLLLLFLVINEIKNNNRINKLLLWYKSENKFSKQKYCTIVRGFLVFLAGVFIVFSVRIVKNSCILEKYVEDFKPYLTFSDNWGTKRGAIWKFAVQVYRDFPIEKKIFGNGADTFGILVQKYGNQDFWSKWSRNVRNAHNEFLQLLCTTGLIGVISYYMLFIRQIKSAFKSNDYVKISIASALIIYLVQQSVNNMQVITTSISFIMVAFLQNNTKSQPS